MRLVLIVAFCIFLLWAVFRFIYWLADQEPFDTDPEF